jgi:hypothetical protein
LSGDSEVVEAVLRQQTTTLPIGTSSGGFAYQFDAATGLVGRPVQNYGPMFGDRPLTIGARRLTVGLTFQHTEWRSLAGQRLSTGFYAHDKFVDDFYTPDFQPVIERFGSRIDLSTDRATVNVTFGLANRLDLNVIVPFGHATVIGGPDYTYSGLQSGTIYRLATDTFSASASGISDVSLRGKYLLISSPRFAFAAIGEIRFPTGDAENLLGTGKRAEKLTGVGSLTLGEFSTHFEAGYLIAGNGLTFNRDPRLAQPRLLTAEPSDEITLTVGADSAITDRLTLTTDLLLRTLRNSAQIVRRVYTQTATREVVGYEPVPGAVSLVLGTVGGKVLIGGDWLLTASVLVPLNSSGVKPHITPVIGFERAF